MSLKKASRNKSLSLSDDFPLRKVSRSNLNGVPSSSSSASGAKTSEDTTKIFKFIDDNVIGKGVVFLGPFGRRKVVYGDYSSSGRSLQFLEDYINKEVLPAYGDMCCSSAVTGLQSKLYYNEAVEIVKSSVNASSEDEIIFCESVYTNPIDRIAFFLSVNSQQNSPVMFVSTSEPEKNLMPWIDLGVQVERVAKTRDGYLDLVDLEQKLATFINSNRQLIGLFSGSSRLSGILADDVATTILLHQYGAISIWDYSLAAPSAQIDVNPTIPGSAKDILFFSCNKFIGGVQSPGVLIVKKSLLSNQSQVNYNKVCVTSAVRAGLVIQLKSSIGTQIITSRYEKMCKLMLSHIRTIPEIVLFGPTCTTNRRIPTICFLVRHPRGAFLHHRFVVAILNDLFGIQATGINNIIEAMNITNRLIVDYDQLLADESIEIETIRPGYTQITLPFFMPESEVLFIMEALKMVATEGWKLLPQYVTDNKTGEWKHYTNSLIKERKWLGSIRYNDGRMLFSDRKISGAGPFPQNYADCLQTARNQFNGARKMAQRTTTHLENKYYKLSKDSAELLRWYMLPGEAHELLLGHTKNVKHTVPFDPNKSDEPPSLLNIHRHNSLSALDVKLYKSRSLPTSPIHLPINRQQSTPSPTPGQIDQRNCATPPVVRFSVGGEVTTIPNFKANPVQAVKNSELLNRNRCHSWSSPDGIPPTLSPQTRMNLGLSTTMFRNRGLTRQRICSCSSQTDLEEVSSPENPTTSPSFQTLNNTGSINSLSSDCIDIEAILKGVTTELATEIKSEIREVIARVEDVLENSDSVDMMTSMNLSTINNMNNSTTEQQRTDPVVSATEVADYLKEYSKGMTDDIKSEIHDIVNVMNDNEICNSTELQRQFTTEKSRESSEFEKTYSSNSNSSRRNRDSLLNQTIKRQISEDFVQFNRQMDMQSDKQIRMKNEDKEDLQIESQNKSILSPEPLLEFQQQDQQQQSNLLPQTGYLKLRSESCPVPSVDRNDAKYSTTSSTSSSKYSIATMPPDIGNTIFKLNDINETISQDSGINLNFSENDEMKTTAKNRLEKHNSKESSTTGSTTMDLQQKSLFRNSSTYSDLSFSMYSSSDSSSNSNYPDQDSDTKKWHHLPNQIWKQTAEAIDEFNMVKDGDKILVCLSGSSASLCLLHALRQFSRARGISIEIGAVSIGNSGVDPRAQMLYLRDLDTKYYFDKLDPSENLRTKLISIARHKKYNVLALGNSLDKLADDFLVSILNRGKLNSIQAHGLNAEEDIRLIRPFIYVRERHLEDFAIQQDMPVRPSKSLIRTPSGSNSILRVQEIMNPNVFENIKRAVRPLLLSQRIETNVGGCPLNYFKTTLISRR